MLLKDIRIRKSQNIINKFVGIINLFICNEEKANLIDISIEQEEFRKALDKILFSFCGAIKESFFEETLERMNYSKYEIKMMKIYYKKRLTEKDFTVNEYYRIEYDNRVEA